MASTKRVRCYSDSNASTSPRTPIRRNLGADSWINSCMVETVATSKAEAERVMEMHGLFVGHNGLNVDGRIDPEHGESLNSYGEALRAAGLLSADRVGACYAHSAQGGGGAVVDVTADGAPVVGHLVPAGPGADVRFEFVPVATGPALADDIAALHGLAPTLSPAHRAALRRVLAVARQTQPEER